MGPEIVYVSGRTRAEGEMNGKSANLNNCLGHLYPDGCCVPANEIVCIFDADQVRCGTHPAGSLAGGGLSLCPGHGVFLHLTIALTQRTAGGAGWVCMDLVFSSLVH